MNLQIDNPRTATQQLNTSLQGNFFQCYESYCLFAYALIHTPNTQQHNMYHCKTLTKNVDLKFQEQFLDSDHARMIGQSLQQTHPFYRMTMIDRLKSYILTMILLIYIETERYRLSSHIDIEQQYRKKYRRLLMILVVQVRIRMAFEDQVFEHFIIDLLKRLKVLPLGIQFMIFLKELVIGLELDCTKELLAIVKQVNQSSHQLTVKKKCQIRNSIQYDYESTPKIIKLKRIDEQTKMQNTNMFIEKSAIPSQKIGFLSARNQIVNSRTLFYRKTMSPRKI